MNRITTVILTLILSLGLKSINSYAAPLPIGSAFSYQGVLKDSGSPANGNYDIGFELFTTATGNLSLLTDEFLNIPVTDGQFTLPQVDFGDAVFAAGTEIWINLYITKTGSGLPYVELTPRQRLNAVPYAVQAEFLAAGNANNDDILQFDGTNWVASALNTSSPWTDSGTSISYNGSVGIGTSSPTDKLHITTTAVGQNPLRIQINGQTKFKVESNGSTTIGTNFVNTPTEGLYVQGNVKQHLSSNGMLKYMVSAVCSNSSNIISFYNGTGNSSAVTIASNGTGACTITFPTDIDDRYFQASPRTVNGNMSVSCGFVGTNQLSCNRHFSATGNVSSGPIMVLIY